MQKYQATCSDSQSVLTAEVCPEPGLSLNTAASQLTCHGECQPKDQSLGQALSPGFVAPLCWCSWTWTRCAHCASSSCLMLQLSLGVPSPLLGCQPQLSLSETGVWGIGAVTGELIGVKPGGPFSLVA